MPDWLSNTAVIASAIAFIGLIFRIGKMVQRLEDVEKRLDRFQEWIKEEIGKLQDGIAKLQDNITDIYGRLPPRTVGRGSPLQLTDLGKEVSDHINATAWAKDKEPLLRDRAEGKRPDEIQALCFAFVKHEYEPDPELDVAIKVAAYENGIDTDQVLDVLAVVLRNRLLVDIVDSN